MTSAVILDVDDTLYLERDYVKGGFAAVGEHVHKEAGVSGFARVAWRLFQEGRRGRIFDQAMCELGLDSSALAVADLVAVYRSHTPEIQLLGDSRATIEQLCGRGVPLGVITDGPAASQRGKIAALGLERYMAIIVVTDELGPGAGKPSDVGFRMVQEALGLPGSSLMYVADNPVKDFVAPHALGWRTVRIRRRGSLYASVDSGNDVHTEHNDLSLLYPQYEVMGHTDEGNKRAGVAR